MVRRSLNRLRDEDGALLEQLICAQVEGGQTYKIDEDSYRRLVGHRIRREDKSVAVSVPTADDELAAVEEPETTRESARMQGLVARTGETMGFKIWLPRHDRTTLLRDWTPTSGSLVDQLPLNYDDVTLKTIEQIDVLWLKGRSIVRAFEVEHTTAIYSGILRMADLLALQAEHGHRAAHRGAGSAQGQGIHRDTAAGVLAARPGSAFGVLYVHLV